MFHVSRTKFLIKPLFVLAIIGIALTSQIASSHASAVNAAVIGYTVSGRVTEGSAGLGGVSVTMSNGYTASTTTDATGNYTFYNIPRGTTFTLRAVKSGYVINPPGATMNGIVSNYTLDFSATNSGGSNIAPTVSIAQPTGGSFYAPPASINIAVIASDTDGIIAKVEFFANGTKLGQTLFSPFTFNWSSVPAGAYALTATATDSGGATTTSTPVSINVSDTNQLTWQRQSPIPTGANLTGAAFTAQSHIFLSGEQHTLIESLDGGATWRKVNLPGAATEPFYEVYFRDANNGFIFGNSSDPAPDFFRTTDGGATWQRITSFPLGGSWYHMDFVSPTVGFMGSNGATARTTDAGTTWTRSSITDPLGLVGVTSIVARPSGKLWVGGSGGVIENSTFVPSPFTFTINPPQVAGGNSSTGTLALRAPAPTGGATFTLASSNTAAATVPASVTVPAGATSATFTILTNSVNATATPIITAAWNGASRKAALDVEPSVACSFNISPASLDYTAAGGDGAINVTSPSGCAWTATSAASWVTITPGAGAGNGVVTYKVAPNTLNLSRFTSVTVAGKTHGIYQTAASATCTFNINPAALTFKSNGGNGVFDVTSATGCNWTASSNANWLTITSGASGTGNGTVNYTVAPNTTSITRQSTITAGGATHTVTQYAPATPVNNGQVLITEFRFAGNTDLDEFVEIYNNTDAALTVNSGDGSAGWAVVAADGVLRFTIPNGTTIPARGHYLGVNTDYSLNASAIADTTYTQDIAADSGVAIYKTANQLDWTAATLLDAAGFAATSPSYREGTGFVGASSAAGQDSYVRKVNATTNLPQDTGNNAEDFMLIATDPVAVGNSSVLGMPGPENLSSPVAHNTDIAPSFIDPTAPRLAAPNFVRTGSGNGGTLAVRRHFTNNTGATVTSLRFRVIDVTTLNSPVVNPPQADLRLSSSTETTAATGLGFSVAVKGTTLEQSAMQASGGGINSTLSVALPTGGLAPGASVDVQFLMNVVQIGRFRFFISVEALP